MSDNIPLEIQVEVMKRLPVKSLLRFRTVSKQWKSVIDSSRFVTAHGVNQTQSHLLLTIDSEVNSVYIFYNDTLTHHHNLSPLINIPTLHAKMIGCSRGLACFSAWDPQNQKDLIFLWNPSIRKCVRISLPKKSYRYELGFGVCPKTNDPKLVRFQRPMSGTDTDPNVYVFALSAGVWKTVPMNMHWPPHTETLISDEHVVIDSVIHWVAHDCLVDSRPLIVSFDLSTEEFETVDLSLALPYPQILYISELNGSLVVLDRKHYLTDYDVWMMIKNGGSKSSFTKLFTLSFGVTPDTVGFQILGFRKNGEVMVGHIIRGVYDVNQTTTLEVYDTDSKQLNEVDRDISCSTSFSMAYYTESLLLINHSDSIIES